MFIPTGFGHSCHRPGAIKMLSLRETRYEAAGLCAMWVMTTVETLLGYSGTRSPNVDALTALSANGWASLLRLAPCISQSVYQP